MLAELDVLVFLKSGAFDTLARAAERVFGALHTPYAPSQLDEEGSDVVVYEAHGLGFDATLYPNEGDLMDPEFENYPYALEISSQFWCVELDTLDLESPLSEYFARLLAFDLDVETSTEIFLETTEEGEVYEIRSFKRNPQFRMDQGPTTPRVFVIESRQVERPFDDEDWEGDEAEDETDDLEPEEKEV